MRFLMKNLIFIALFTLSQISFAQGISLEDAREVKIVKMEYSEASGKGVIRIAECGSCKYELYNFTSKLEVKKNGSVNTIEKLLKEYWTTKIAVIFTTPGTNDLLRISYR